MKAPRQGAPFLLLNRFQLISFYRTLKVTVLVVVVCAL